MEGARPKGQRTLATGGQERPPYLNLERYVCEHETPSPCLLASIGIHILGASEETKANLLIG